MSKVGHLIENYIYFYHLDKFCVIPQYPEQLGETNNVNFEQTNILGRSAPIFTYSHSGPRHLTINLHLHRDMMQDRNLTPNSFGVEDGDDIIQALIDCLECSCLPKYTDATKMIDPPIVAIRFGKNFFIKGVVVGGVQKTHSGPIIDDKYAECAISFTVGEYDPYDAISVSESGAYRGLDSNLANKLSGGGRLL